MAVLRDYHAALGELVFAYEGTLEHFAGDGLMVFFNDPPPCPDAPERAVRMALDMRDRVDELAAGGAGRATAWASASASPRATRRWAGSGSRDAGTTPRSGPSPTSRRGSVPRPRPRQILVSPRVLAGLDERFETRSLGPVELRGISRPVEVHEVIGTVDREDDP